VFLPAADLFEELRVEFLECLGLFDELLFQPLDGRRLICDKKLEL